MLKIFIVSQLTLFLFVFVSESIAMSNFPHRINRKGPFVALIKYVFYVLKLYLKKKVQSVNLLMLRLDFNMDSK